MFLIPHNVKKRETGGKTEEISTVEYVYNVAFYPSLTFLALHFYKPNTVAHTLTSEELGVTGSQ